ncbi:hypothetical protein [Nocardia sp. NPDC059228]|uniref:hypothetical protein n=1 Tax=Nocardia sp. NPDC059228 TaxID=3346777 RepID=UPI00367AC395
MSDKTVDEITRELSKFGSAAAYAFQQWRRANPNATKVPRGVWKQMDLADRNERWNAKIRLRQQLRAQGEERKIHREDLFTQLDKRINQHRRDTLDWHNRPAATYDQHMRRQWELMLDRQDIERRIASTPGMLSVEERGQAVRALEAAHHAWRPEVKPVPVRSSGPLAGVAALKARVAERFSRIRLGITERGRTGHRPQLDRPAAPKTRQQVMGELRHLIADRHEMAMNANLLAERLRERGASIETFAPDAAQMAEGHRRNLAALDREISDRITGSGMPVEDWLEVQFQLREQTPERQAGQRWLQRQSTWDLENRYRINSWDRHVDWVTGPDSLRRWDHDFPEREDQQRREFLNPPAGWEPVDPDATDRFMFLIDSEHNKGLSHVRTFGYPQSGYDWVQRKMSWIAEPQDNVSITVWDRAVPLDANNRVRGFAIDSMQGLYANLDPDLDRRYEYFRDLSMTRARDRSIPADLSVPGLEDLNQDRLLPWTSVRAGNIYDGEKIHSIGESGRVWTVDEARWFAHRAPKTLEGFEAKFAQIQRNAFYDINEDLGWSEEIEHARYGLDHSDALDPEARARAREILTITETEAKLGQRPDRDLWAAVVDRAEFDRWSGLETPGTPQRPQAFEAPQQPEAPDWLDGDYGPSIESQFRAPEQPRTDPLAHVRSVQEEMRNRAAAQPEQPQRPEAPEAPEAPAAPDGSVVIVQSEVLDKLERDLAEMTERAERAERERNSARGQRDEAVAKLVRRTPPEQRYGSPQRRAAERPGTPEAPEAPAQPDREDLPHDRDEQPAYDRSDMTAAESVPDWSGIPEPPEPPEFEPIPSGHNGWDGFER